MDDIAEQLRAISIRLQVQACVYADQLDTTRETQCERAGNHVNKALQALEGSL